MSGTWKDLTDNVNVMASNLTGQVRSIAQVASAVGRGDLSQRIRVEAAGEVAALADVINTMVDTLSAFADEVTRVAREVGTEGRLGGQAHVPGVAGTWKDLTDNVNSMANNLTGQVRNIALVTTAVARGDLSKKIDVDARGEILELKTTINTMVDQLSAFAQEVTRVAREVGTEGRLGGQAEVEGVSGTWKRLTENVNELAGNLTRQVRAIAEVTSAVAEGDLTRSVNVEASGEVAELKDNINAMVESLRETTRANQEQDWLKTNLARVSGLMQGHRDLPVVAELIMDELVPLVSAQYGAFYLAEDGEDGPELRLVGSYGYPDDSGRPTRIPFGKTLVGQAARSRRTIMVDALPPDYVTISSGLGQVVPTALVLLPIVVEGQVLGVIELASVTPFTQIHQDFLAQLMETIGVNVNTIVANARTDELLVESQRLTAELQERSAELQTQQEELQRSNAELEDKAALLAAQNRDIEAKNLQIEQARQELEARAQQLSLASKYKSEFLANMSHELRTPLNSLLILAQLLAQNPSRNLPQAGGVRADHPLGGLGPAAADQRHPRPVEGRGGEDGRQPRAGGAAPPRRVRRGHVPADDHAEEPGLHGGDRAGRARGPAHRRLAAASGAAQPAVQRGEVHRARPGGAADRAGPGRRGAPAGAAGRSRGRLPGAGHRRGHPGAAPGVDLRRLPAGRRHHQPQVRRHGPGPVHHAGDRAPAGRRGHRGQRRGPGLHVHAVPAGGPARLRAAAAARGGRGGRAGGGGAARGRVRPDARDRGGPLPAGPAPAPAAGGGGAAPGLLTLVAESVVQDVAHTGGGSRPAVDIITAVGAQEAAGALAADPCHCVVLELGMAEAEVTRFLEALRGDSALASVPVLVHSGHRADAGVEASLRERASGTALEFLSSLDELRERIALHLSAEEPGDVLSLVRPDEAQRTAPEAVVDGSFAGRTVLVVDDDARNLFALSGILELHGFRVLHAEDGRKGIERLVDNPDVALVLMDVMMPELDGYAATAEIRSMPQYADLPIIAVTAKAMPGDREKSLASGASDYVTKPVDSRELIACVRRWLPA